MSMKQRRLIQRGFSLLELLAVIGIIAILAGILFPVFASAKENGYRTNAMMQAKQIGLGLSAYLDQNDNGLLPSTNYGAAESSPDRLWTTVLQPTIKSTQVFIAPGSEGKFADGWSKRGWQTIGYNSSTAIDPANGCKEKDLGSADNKCQSFRTALSFSKQDTPSQMALFAVTPGGEVSEKYEGYEFNPYNGTPNPEKPAYGPPLVSDRDLVKELGGILPAEQIKPIYARYLKTGRDDGTTPVIFGDGHAKDYSARQLSSTKAGIVWRLR